MVLGLCKYKDMLGEPGKGVHAYRIGGMAVVDLVLTILLAAALYQIPWVYARFRFRYLVIALVLLGTLVHRAFCVETALTKRFFND